MKEEYEKIDVEKRKKYFYKTKKLSIFAPAYANKFASAGKPAESRQSIRHWRNGRVVECGSLENC